MNRIQQVQRGLPLSEFSLLSPARSVEQESTLRPQGPPCSPLASALSLNTKNTSLAYSTKEPGGDGGDRSERALKNKDIFENNKVF